MKHRFFFPAIFCLVTLGLVSCQGQTPPVVSAPTRTPKIIQTAIVGKSAFAEQVQVTGVVSPVRETVISTQ